MSRDLADAARAINIPQSTIRSDGERVFRSRSPWCSYADGGLPKIWKGHSLGASPARRTRREPRPLPASAGRFSPGL